MAVFQAEAQADDLALAFGQAVEHLAELFLQHAEARGVGRNDRGVVLDEVAELGILFLADRRLERNRLLRDLLDLADALFGQAHDVADFLRGRFAAELLEQLALDAHELVDRLDHVHGDADGARLVGDRAGDGLADPPRRVRGELEALAIVELLDGADKAQVAFLDEVEEEHATAHVTLRDGNDEAQVRLDELLLRVEADFLDAR